MECDKTLDGMKNGLIPAYPGSLESIRASDEARGPQVNGMSMELLSVLKIQGSPVNQDLTRDALQQFISNKTWH